jgi:hypothetical protein
MSSHDHAADHGHAHDVDLEPATELSPGEPLTPMWVPAVGLALLLSAAVWALVSNKEDAPAQPTGDVAATKPASAAVAAAPTPQPPAAQRPGTGTGTGPVPLPGTPEQLANARRMLEDAAKRGQIPAGGQPGSAKSPTAPQAGH